MRRALVILLTALALCGGARAQSARQNDADVQQILSQASADLRGAEAGFRTEPLADEEIRDRLTAVAQVQARLSTALTELGPRLQTAQARLAQLGPAPPGAKGEDARVAAVRRQLTRLTAILQSDDRETRMLQAEAQQTADGLAERLRENFRARLASQDRPPFDPALWKGLAASLPGDLSRLAQVASDEADAASGAISDRRNLGVALGGALLALLVGVPLRLLLILAGRRRAQRAGADRRLVRALFALWRVGVGAGIPLLALFLLRAALLEADVLTEPMDAIVGVFVRAVGFGLFIERLGSTILSVHAPMWRIAPAPDAAAARLRWAPVAAGATTALAAFSAGVDAALAVSQSAQVVSDYATTGLEALAVGAALVGLSRARVAEAASADPPAEARLPWVLATVAVWAALIVAVAAMLTGYLAFAGFLLREAIWIGAILVLLLLLLRVADEETPAVLAPQSRLGSAIQAGLGLSSTATEQIGVLASGAARLILILLAWAAVMAPFGAGVGEIFGRLTASNFVIRLGKTQLSPGAILGAGALFVIGLAATRAVRRWLEDRYLPTTALDTGLRSSVASGITWTGGLAAVLIAFAYLGLSITQITLLASALSVGIGFGLQPVIGNFVSGVVLLAERPVKVGDWVALGDQQGDIRRISMRATEIELADRSHLIVPNMEFVSKAVRNVTRAGALGRIAIALKVVDSADPAKVRDLVLSRLRARRDVLQDPAPAVYLTDVRDGFLEMTAFAYMADPRGVFVARSELLFQLVPDLKAAGIALWSNASVVNVSAAPPGPTAPDQA